MDFQWVDDPRDFMPLKAGSPLAFNERADNRRPTFIPLRRRHRQ
jgi:hypothetical protein